MADYPTMIAPVNHMEPVPGGSAAPRRPHNPGHHPCPVRLGVAELSAVLHPARRRGSRDLLVDEQHPQRLSRGTARRHGLRAGETSGPRAARVYREDAYDPA